MACMGCDTGSDLVVMSVGSFGKLVLVAVLVAALLAWAVVRVGDESADGSDGDWDGE